jgi:hypothetical protein
VLFLGFEDVHQQADAVRLAVDHVFMLHVGLALRFGGSQEKRNDSRDWSDRFVNSHVIPVPVLDSAQS